MNFHPARFAAEKFHRLMANANDFSIVTIDRHNGRLVQKNSSVRLIDEGVDSTQIDSEFVFEKLLNELHGDGSSSKLAGFREASYHSRAATRMPETTSVSYSGDVLENNKE